LVATSALGRISPSAESPGFRPGARRGPPDDEENMNYFRSAGQVCARGFFLHSSTNGSNTSIGILCVMFTNTASGGAAGLILLFITFSFGCLYQGATLRSGLVPVVAVPIEPTVRRVNNRASIVVRDMLPSIMYRCFDTRRMVVMARVGVRANMDNSVDLDRRVRFEIGGGYGNYRPRPACEPASTHRIGPHSSQLSNLGPGRHRRHDSLVIPVGSTVSSSTPDYVHSNDGKTRNDNQDSFHVKTPYGGIGPAC